ncbi:MAG: hypothetical protein ACKPKO_33610, partial [Candidatus Fonsibacter sp.]
MNELVRSIRAEPCVLKYWPLGGNLRLVGYPDAANRYNADNNSQRGQVIFLSEDRTKSKDGYGSMIDVETHNIKYSGIVHYGVGAVLSHHMFS